MINYSKVTRKNLQALDAPEKTYALAQSRDRLDSDGLAAHMASHNTPYSRGVIKGVLDDFVDCVRELILDGYIIDLGSLGTFNVSLKSRGVSESEVDEKTGLKPVFTYMDILDVKCRFTPGKSLLNLKRDAKFHEVVSAKENSLVIKKKQEERENPVKEEEQP